MTHHLWDMFRSWQLTNQCCRRGQVASIFHGLSWGSTINKTVFFVTIQRVVIHSPSPSRRTGWPHPPVRVLGNVVSNHRFQNYSIRTIGPKRWPEMVESFVACWGRLWWKCRPHIQHWEMTFQIFPGHVQRYETNPVYPLAPTQRAIWTPSLRWMVPRNPKSTRWTLVTHPIVFRFQPSKGRISQPSRVS